MMKEDAIISGPQRSNQGCKTKIYKNQVHINVNEMTPCCIELEQSSVGYSGAQQHTQWLVAYDQRQELFHFSGSSRGRLLCIVLGDRVKAAGMMTRIK